MKTPINHIATIIIVCLYSMPALAEPTDIYLVRHGETIGNLTHKHTHKNDRTLSPNGEQQVAKLTRRLGAFHFNHFDHIVVSPKYRVLISILPYLKQHHLTAEIWPELEECCWQKNRATGFDKPARGAKIKLEKAMRPYFTFPDVESRFRLDSNNYAQGMMQTFMATQKIQQRFAGTGQRILIVAHYHIGSRILEILQGLEPKGRYQIANTQISHLRENPDGSFKLIDTSQR